MYLKYSVSLNWPYLQRTKLEYQLLAMLSKLRDRKEALSNQQIAEAEAQMERNHRGRVGVVVHKKINMLV